MYRKVFTSTTTCELLSILFCFQIELEIGPWLVLKCFREKKSPWGHDFVNISPTVVIIDETRIREGRNWSLTCYALAFHLSSYLDRGYIFTHILCVFMSISPLLIHKFKRLTTTYAVYRILIACQQNWWPLNLSFLRKILLTWVFLLSCFGIIFLVYTVHIFRSAFTCSPLRFM